MYLSNFCKEKKLITRIICFFKFFFFIIDCFHFFLFQSILLYSLSCEHQYKKNISRYANEQDLYTHVHLLIGVMSPLSKVHQHKYKLPLSFTNGKVFIISDFQSCEEDIVLSVVSLAIILFLFLIYIGYLYICFVISHYI